MIPCNCCKHRNSVQARRDARRAEQGPRTRAERVETRRNVAAPRGPSGACLGLPQLSLRRLAVEPRRREGATGARRSPSHTVDCKGAHAAEHGPVSASRVGTGRGWRTGRGARTRTWPSTRSAGDQRHGRRGQRRNGSTATRASALRRRAPPNLSGSC